MLASSTVRSMSKRLIAPEQFRHRPAGLDFLHRDIALGTCDQPDCVQAISLVDVGFAAGDYLVISRPQPPAPLSYSGAWGALGLPVNLKIHTARSMRLI